MTTVYCENTHCINNDPDEVTSLSTCTCDIIGIKHTSLECDEYKEGIDNND